jgi:hypothetical protein
MTTHSATLNTPAYGAALGRTMAVLLVWFFAALAAGLSGAFVTKGGPPIGIGVAITAPLLVYWLDGRAGHPLLAAIARLEPPTLALLQTFRVLGVVFVVGWARGALPSGFALPAGFGDIAVGLAAPFVAVALGEGKPHARRLFIAWNVLGVADLVTAVFLGVAHSGSAFGFLHATPPSDVVATYPLSMIPTFFVPLALILHGVSLSRAAQGKWATTGLGPG